MNALLTKETYEIIEKSVIPNFDDGIMIFLDWNKLSPDDINRMEYGCFDVVNIPKEDYRKMFPNYYVTFYYSLKSSTGVVGMFIHRNREIFKTTHKYKLNKLFK